jgi:ClpP class serine protease
MSTTEVPTNKQIDAFIATGRFEIDEQWGMEQLAEYHNELALLQAGAPYAELGIGKRREASRPGIIAMGADGMFQRIADPGMLTDPAATPPGSFAHLRLQGVMRGQDGASSQGINSLIDNLHQAFQNENIVGILLEVNTGGGESLAGSMLQAVLAESPKPVVAWAHFMASAGVRATAPVDEIVASSDAARIGSIGTYITLDKRFSSWYANNYEDLYADKSTNKNTDFREYVKGNKAPLQEMINKSNNHFLAEVEKYRPLKRDVEHTLSGAMFDAREARSRGLVDGIGNFNYAVQRLQANVKRRQNTNAK